MKLSPEQRRSLWLEDGSPWSGNRIISARPGTGKTSTLTEYCLSLAQGWLKYHKPWQGMAIVSYTNVARLEIERKVTERGRSGEMLASPHFIGTIDAFINQHIFLRFGSQLMLSSGSRPRLVGAPHGVWRAEAEVLEACKAAGGSSGNLFDCYSLNRSGSVVRLDSQPRMIRGKPVTPVKVTPSNEQKIRAMKATVWSAGYATQADANFVALQVLLKSPATAMALARRFSVLVVDEAQDMTEVQHELLLQLQLAGHTWVVLVGDERQAIYEWNTAKPDLFMAKIDRPDLWSPKELTETFRCSPAICRYLSIMAGGAPLVPAAGGKNQCYNESVAVVGMPKKQAQQSICSAIDDMVAKLSGKPAHGSNVRVKTIAVLGRSRSDALLVRNAFAGYQNGGAVPVWQNRLTRDFLRVLHYLAQDDYHQAFRSYESFLAACIGSSGRRAVRIVAENYLRAQGAPGSYRRRIFTETRRMRSALPAGDVMLSDCVAAANAEQTLVRESRLKPLRAEIASFGAKRSGEDCPIAHLFADSAQHETYPASGVEDVEVLFSTIHGVKGETFDGVVFFVKSQTAPCGCSPGSNRWPKILEHDLSRCEGKRLAYVALSRAAQMLTILSPIEDVPTWNQLGGVG